MKNANLKQAETKKTVLVLKDGTATRIYFNCPTLKKAKEHGLNTKNWMWEKITESEGQELIEELHDYGMPFNFLRL